MAAKRARTMNPENDDIIQFLLADPAKPPRVEIMEGTRRKVSKVIFDGPILSMHRDQPFWQLWKHCPDVLLCLPDHTNPIIDLYAPLHTLTSRTLVMREMKPDYEYYRHQLQRLHCEEQLEEAQNAVIYFTEKVENEKLRVEELKQRIAELISPTEVSIN